LSEYAVLLYSCVLITYIFLSWLLPINSVMVILIAILFSFIFIWIRITFCRFRYDMLIIISWKILLPVVLCMFLCFIPILFLSFSII
jgi:NADH:ubiquinone oxidoreductase subunit H